VIQAVDDHGRPVVVEWCVDGKGTIGLSYGLIPGHPIVSSRATATRYRVHACPRPAALERAFSAANFPATEAGSPNNYYRSSGAPRRRGRK
jgi:hypothetical protein